MWKLSIKSIYKSHLKIQKKYYHPFLTPFCNQKLYFVLFYRFLHKIVRKITLVCIDHCTGEISENGAWNQYKSHIWRFRKNITIHFLSLSVTEIGILCFLHTFLHKIVKKMTIVAVNHSRCEIRENEARKDFSRIVCMKWFMSIIVIFFSIWCRNL